MKILVRLTFFYFLFFHPVMVLSQEIQLSGVVVDAETNIPLPFVNVIYNSKNQGITTDIDGKFGFVKLSQLEFLKFSYLGYEPLMLKKDFLIDKKTLTIKLNKKLFEINEVLVFPGENPAHGIIRKVLENKKQNKPENLDKYSYTSYNKIIFTLDMERARQFYSDSEKIDSDYVKMKKFSESQYIFMMESVSERNYKYPGKSDEKIIASRVSGFSEPSFVLLATQLQSFSFYDDMITLLDSRYINPVGNGFASRYFFNIEDTTISERGDTVFSISFRPKKNKNFEGLTGLLNINTYHYAIQNVIASPVESNGLIDIKIQQNYRLIDDKYWFPNELNTTLIFGNFVKTAKGNASANIIGIGKNYLTDVKINQLDSGIKFDDIELELNKSAHKQPDSVWQKYRAEPLTAREIKTYTVLDSIGKEEKLDFKLKTIKTLSTGYIPFHFIDINIFSLLDFNVYEGFRPGLGIKTNQKLSSLFSVGAYFAYGFRDEKFKYGGNLIFFLYPKREMQLEFGYSNDVIESSGYRFYNENVGLNSTELYRKFFIKDMTYSIDYTLQYRFRLIKHLNTNIVYRQSARRNISGYSFHSDGTTFDAGSNYNFSEALVQFKYTPKEQLAYLAGELISSNPGSTPVFYVNFIRGFENNFGEFNYSRIEARIDFSFNTKALGKTGLNIVSGKIIGDLPYFMLYNGHESYYDFDVESANSFATMRMNEFLSDKFFSLHFRHDFGSLLFKTEKFKPEFLITTSMGFGNLEKPHLHQGITFKTMEKGYFESGLLINNILRQLNFIGYGFGIFYRYGPYSFSNISDNFAYKLTLNFKL